MKTSKILQLKFNVFKFIQGRTLGVQRNFIGAELPKLAEIVDALFPDRSKVPKHEFYDQVGRAVQELRKEGKIRKAAGLRWEAI